MIFSTKVLYRLGLALMYFISILSEINAQEELVLVEGKTEAV